MSLPYRTRRKLTRAGMIATAVLAVGIVAWLCWVVWLERYVVYSGSTATLDFSVSAQELTGEVARPPVAEANVPIYYNEGSDALNISSDMTQINGYYITNDDMKTEMDTIMTTIQRLSPETAVMVEMKGPYGSFFYNSNLEDAIPSASTDIPAVEKMVQALKTRGCYLIAKVSALRDWNFGNNHVTSGLYMLNRAGLWLDKDGYFWLDPTNATTTSWLTSVVAELKEMGFDEVMLADFRFPTSDQYIFTGDKTQALQDAMNKLITACGSNNFVLSFGVEDLMLELPAESRSRLYLENVDAASVESKASQLKVEDPKLQAVFVAGTNDSRFDNYSALRSIALADMIEAQKQG